MSGSAAGGSEVRWNGGCGGGGGEWLVEMNYLGVALGRPVCIVARGGVVLVRADRHGLYCCESGCEGAH